MVLYAPVTDSKEPCFLSEKKFREELEEKGCIKHFNDGKLHQVTQEYIDEILRVNTKELLQNVNCPVLIIHGDKDEIIPLNFSKNSLKYLPDAKLEVIVGGDHPLNDNMDEVIPLTIDWFKKIMK